MEFRGSASQATNLTFRDSRDSAIYSWKIENQDPTPTDPTHPVQPDAAAAIAIAKEIAKCYRANPLQVPRNMSPLVGTDMVCISHTPTSRSGAFTFKFYSQTKLTTTLGASLADAQPRCMGCYDFQGIEGKMEFRGSASQATNLTFRDSRDSAIYSWKIFE
jgi:hypothetical protein